MPTPHAPYHHEPHDGDGCMWWTVRCDGSPEILNVEGATARLNAQHAEIERLREATRWRSVAEELPPDDMLVALFWDGKHCEILDNLDGGCWSDDFANGHMEGITHWQPLPDSPQ